MNLVKSRYCVALSMAVLLAACGGGGDDDSDNVTPTPPEEPGNPDPGTPDTVSLQGVLVVPESQAAVVARTLAIPSATQARIAKAETAAACTDIPAGYLPVAQASVTFADDEGNALGTAVTTDDCGAFSASVPQAVTTVLATSAAGEPVEVPVAAFLDGSNDPVVSVRPKGAEYRISLIQWVDDKLAFTVTDTVSRKAVLGLPTRAASLKVGDASIAFGSLSYAATSAQAASVALVLDASGSMTWPAQDPATNQAILDANGNAYTGLRLASRAAHAFLDGKRADDEIGIHIFDGYQAWIDQTYFDNARLVTADDQQAYAPSYGDSGFHTDAKTLRLPVDYYNNRSAIWGSSAFDELHADIQPAVRAQGSYPFGGGTSLFDAGKVAVEKVAARGNARKIVVLLTDGDATDYDRPGLLTAAKDNSVPLWTVGLGSSFNDDNLQVLADETGGSYIKSADPKALAAEFEAIQTGIVFQYVTEPISGVSAGDVIKLTVSYGNGQTAERELTVPTK